MKTRYIILLALAAGMVGAQSDKIIEAGRFVVFGKSGKPAVVMTTDAIGGGEFAVFDASGKEVFAVRGGRVVSDDLDRRFAQPPAPAAAPAQSTSQPPVKPAKPQAGTVMMVAAPQGVDVRMLRVEIIDVIDDGKMMNGGPPHMFTVKVKITNAGRNIIKGTSLRPSFVNQELGHADYNKPATVRDDLAPGDSVERTFVGRSVEPLTVKSAAKAIKLWCEYIQT